MKHFSSHESLAVISPSVRTAATTGRASRTRPCPHSPSVSRSSCRLSDLCLPISLNKTEIIQLDELIERNRPLRKGEHLYRQRDEFRSIYAVRSGSFRAYLLGQEGEIIGMDGIGSRAHGVSTMALEHSSICEIPFSQLERLSHELPNLQSRFFAIMGNEIVKDQKIHTLLSSYTAEQRLASFLLSLSTRYARCQLSSERFLLHMTRGDIGEYLGLTLETVSRGFSGLQRKGAILVKNREIDILEMNQLKAILGEQVPA